MSLMGQPAPTFTLKNTDREDVTLSDLRGQKVVLAFYPAAFTGVCEKEMCSFRDALSSFNDVNAAVFGISVDNPFTNGAFAAKNGINFPLLSDYSRETVKAYGIPFDNFAGLEGYTSANRAVFVIDENGNVAYEWIAPSLGTEPDYDEVKAAAS
ncbi:MAG: peroxiredoxin [Myxococcota bacterium]